MPWKESTAMTEKKEFINELLDKEVTIKSLCKKYGISEKTGHKWKNRFLKYGLLGLEELSRKPLSSPEKLDEDTVIRIINLKKAHEKWGPKKIQSLLEKENGKLNTPCRTSVFRVLDKAKLVKKRKIKVVKTDNDNVLRNRIEPKTVNDVWTVDFKGYWFSKGEKCLPLTIRDLMSRFILNITLCPNATCETVKSVFEQVFKKYGLPKVIRSDNGSPFASYNAPLGLTGLSAWFISLDILPDRIDLGKPGQNGAHERMHRDIANEIEKRIPGGVKRNQIVIDEWREEYNNVRPHEALGMKTPSDIYVKSSRKYEKIDIVEYPIAFHSRKVGKGGYITLHGKQYRISEALKGFTIGLQETEVSSEYRVWLNNFPLFILDVALYRIKTIKERIIERVDLPMSCY